MDIGRAEYYAVTDAEALEAFQHVSKLEGIIPALETSHAFAYLKVGGGPGRDLYSREILFLHGVPSSSAVSVSPLKQTMPCTLLPCQLADGIEQNSSLHRRCRVVTRETVKLCCRSPL